MPKGQPYPDSEPKAPRVGLQFAGGGRRVHCCRTPRCNFGHRHWLRTQLGTLLHQEILQNTPVGSQYLRFWGHCQELSLAPTLALAAAVAEGQMPELEGLGRALAPGLCSCQHFVLGDAPRILNIDFLLVCSTGLPGEECPSLGSKYI